MCVYIGAVCYVTVNVVKRESYRISSKCMQSGLKPLFTFITLRQCFCYGFRFYYVTLELTTNASLKS
jgi:hypothetical protein